MRLFMSYETFLTERPMQETATAMFAACRSRLHRSRVSKLYLNKPAAKSQFLVQLSQTLVSL